jgi:toxin-antitoxin system PIN domain toxin
VIALDTNILIYAHRAESTFNAPAMSCLRALAEGGTPWLIPWPCLHEFLVVVTHRRVFPVPTPLEIALAQVDLWLESPSLLVRGESERHWETLRTICVGSKPVGPLFHDARIAAICLDHGASVLWTADRDFARFPAIRAENPLVSR